MNRSTPYPEALPILLAHLQKDYPGPVREGIARALAVPDAKFGWRVIANLDKKETDARVKDGLAVAIAAAADDSVIDELIELARDHKHGSKRVLLLRALARSKEPRAWAALMAPGSDPDLQQEVARAVRSKKN